MVGTDKRKTPRDRKQNLLIWYWGRRGGGAHYCLEVARELARRGEFNVHLSISRNCHLYAELKALNLPGLDVDTSCDIGSAVMALSRIPQVRRAFENYLEEHDIDLVLCTMQHLWNPFMLSAIRRTGSAMSSQFMTPRCIPANGSCPISGGWTGKFSRPTAMSC